MGKTHFVVTLLTRSSETAAEFIRRGGIVAFPTETVYGLGADIFDESAIAKIFEAKQRPADNPLIAHVGSIDQITMLAAAIPAVAQRLIDAFFPGPLTIVLAKAARVPLIATAGLETIGVRMPSTTIAREFLSACRTPVVAPSANLSGRPSPTTWKSVLEDLDGRIDCILQGEPTIFGLESTVVDCTAARPILLRKGAVSMEALREVTPEIEEHVFDEDGATRSPGLKHRHYSPKAKVVVIERTADLKASTEDGYIGLRERPVQLKRVRICADADDYAHSLFEFFRECDRLGVKRIFCESVAEQGIGAALMDRIRRAAAG
jgi:L-threonylcarbamoyladenylate synthase